MLRFNPELFGLGSNIRRGRPNRRVKLIDLLIPDHVLFNYSSISSSDTEEKKWFFYF